jgi:hypothetical protein
VWQTNHLLNSASRSVICLDFQFVILPNLSVPKYMKKINILFLMDSLRFGGAEKQTIDLINRLDTSQFCPSLCYFRNEKHLIEDSLDKNRVAHIDCLEKSGKFDFGLFGRLKAILDKTNPQIVLCINPYQSIFAHLLKHRYGYAFKIIPIMHTTIYPSMYLELIAKFIFAPLANRSESVLFVCRNQMEYWIHRYGIDKKRAQYIYNSSSTVAKK